ncbi:hypothetical protein [Gracilibacillus lacisalsi]|uniref:hypothetical protein n=1 Tax=Gracilibacillus lacisalsi TaxID=393087 RepID=UPI000366232C|nr:hypothetical protein [Gracilibacillus lacisalsi]
MNRKTFNIIGWILLLGMGASWIAFGYSSWYLLLTPMWRTFLLQFTMAALKN